MNELSRTRPASIRHGAAASIAVFSAFVGALGCNAVFDPGKYHVLSATLDGGDGLDGSSSGDAAGTSDAAVDACAPGEDRPSLENACTTASCVAFPTTLPSCDGGLCPLTAAPPTADGGATASADAGTLTPCTQVRSDATQIIFVTGSTALRSFIQEVSKVLATQPTNPVTVVYQASASCLGVKAAIDPGNNPLVPSNGGATYYDATGAQQSCALDPVQTSTADLGASDVFYSTCYLGQVVTPTLPQDVSDDFGPVQIMNFAVPESSSQRSISLNAAYYVFGFGGNTYPVAPWTDPTQLQIRSASSGTQSMIAAAIGVPAGQWWGVSNGSSAGVGGALVAAGQSSDPTVVDSALGILASDYLTQNSQTLRGLAVQDENASCAFYPGSTATAHDDINVRDGHYPLWGPSHFYARVNAQSQLPTKPGVTQFVDGLAGITPLPGLDLIAEYASKGLVPACAMHVSRTSDGGGYKPYKAATTCNCYFDLIATGATSCAMCNTDSDCPASAPSCNKFGPAPQQGYCDL